MTYWEFLIQREDDRSWKTLTSPNLQIVEGKYRIIANTNAIDAVVRTQVFYHTDNDPPQLSQSRSQSITPEGVLVILPFTHLQVGVWQFKCNVSTTDDREVCQSLKLKVLTKVVQADSTSSELLTAESVPAPAHIMETAVGDLDRLLDGIETPKIETPSMVLQELTIEPEQPPISPIIEEAKPIYVPMVELDNEDPFDAALRIATADQQARTRNNPIGKVNPEPTLQQILASTTVEAITLGTPDVPLHSYDVKTYEVVVED
jgi:hypothetical protein